MSNAQPKLIIAVIAVLVLSRLLPHPVNFTALTAFSVLSFSYFSRGQALFSVLLSLFLSDAVLAYYQQWPLFGYWSYFTYSGFALIVWVQYHWVQCGASAALLVWLPSATLGYWTWTNLGVWLTSTMYPNTASGLVACFTAAIPFLQHALVGDFFWLFVLMLGFKSLASPRFEAIKARYQPHLPLE